MTEKFGIEIEFLGLGNDEDARYALPDFLFEERCYGGYRCRMHHDGSVKSCSEHDNTEHCTDDCHDEDWIEHGAEIVTRPLKVCEESFDEVRMIFIALNEAGAWVNNSCGIHVHIDAEFVRSYPDKQAFFRLARAMYAKYEDAIDTRMDRHRQRGRNTYCQSMKVERDEYVYNDRYFKLNTASFVRHGTIEFRHHHGSLDAEEVIAWAKSCLVFIHYVRAVYEANYETPTASLDEQIACLYA